MHRLVLAGRLVLAAAADAAVLRRRRLAGGAAARLHVDVAIHGVVLFGPKALVARRFRTAKPVSAPFGFFGTFSRALWSPGLSCPASVLRPVLARPGFMIDTGRADSKTRGSDRLAQDEAPADCGLARAFGDDPTSPSWTKLGKAKATSVIGAMLERVNAQASAGQR